MPHFRTAGGAILEMDVPPAGSIAREWHDAKVATGELSLVEHVEQIGDPATGLTWREVPAPAAAEPAAEDEAPRRARKA